MASRWPTDILTIGTRRVWGRIFAISIDADTVDALGDPLILKGDAGRTNTASASIRGTARVGDEVTAPDGRVWVVTGVNPSDLRFGGDTILELEQDVIVEGE